MKKTIVLLLSLILLFSFVSCNGSTNSPSDSSSTNKPTITVQTAPVDTNVPKNEADLKDFSADSDLPKIQAIIGTLSDEDNAKKASLNMDLDATTSYSLKKDAIIEGKALSGTFTLREIQVRNSEKYVSKNIFNGSIKIGGSEYTFNNFCIDINAEGDFTYSGTISKGGINLDYSDLKTTEIELYNFIFGYHNCSVPQSVNISRTGAYVKYNVENIVGEYSIIPTATENSMVADTTVNFSKIIGTDSKTYSFTTKYKFTTPFNGDPSISVEYVSIGDENGVNYYKPSDFIKDDSLRAFLMYFTLID